MRPKAQIGRELQRFDAHVERGRLQLFAKAIGETDPIFFDVEAARAAGYPDIVAPPTFVYCLSEDVPDPNAALTVLGLDVARSLHAEQSISQDRVICAGDTLHGVTVLSDCFEKKGGTLVFARTRTDFRNGDGERVAQLEATVAVRGDGG